MEVRQQVVDLARLSDLLDDLTSMARKVDGIMEVADQLIRRPSPNNDAFLHHIGFTEREIVRDSHNLEMLALSLLEQTPPLGKRNQRMVRATIAINFELERMADYLKACIRMNSLIASLPLSFTQPLLAQMLQTVRTMLRATMVAMLEGNTEIIVVIVEQDALLNELYSQLHEELVPLLNVETSESDSLTVLLVIATKIERMGNRIVNIGEQVLYVES